MADAREGTATVMLSSDEVTKIVAEWVANHSGLARPVQHHVEWMWSPGKGPVANVRVESVPNVRQLVRSKAKRNG